MWGFLFTPFILCRSVRVCPESGSRRFMFLWDAEAWCTATCSRGVFYSPPKYVKQRITVYGAPTVMHVHGHGLSQRQLQALIVYHETSR